MTKIAVLLPDLRAGGAERLHIDLAKEWLTYGLVVEFVLCRARGELLKLAPTKAAVVDLRARRMRSALLPLIKYLRNKRPDVLLSAMWPLSSVGPLAARLSGFDGRIAISEHSPLSLAYSGKGRVQNAIMRKAQRLTYPIADTCITVSQGVADDLARMCGLPREIFKVIYNPAATGRGVHEDSLPSEIRRLRGPLLLSVGTLKPIKRHDVLIEAFARLPRKLDATLCILGDGPERANIDNLIRSLGLSDRVLLCGFVDETAAWYAKADLLVLSSDYEGFGNVIVEALEQGTPVVCTDCPYGPREILADGRYGTLVPPGNPDALSCAILESLQTVHESEMYIRRAQDFRLDNIAGQYLDLMLPGWRAERNA